MNPAAALADLLGQLERAATFAGAVAGHVAAGSRQTSPAELARRRALCDACPLRDHARDACTHAACGCNLSPGMLLPGKLHWAEQSCPAWQWGPEAFESGPAAGP